MRKTPFLGFTPFFMVPLYYGMDALSTANLFVEQIRFQLPARSQLVIQLPAPSLRLSARRRCCGPGRARKRAVRAGVPIAHLADLASLVTLIIPQRAFSVNRPLICSTNKNILGRSGKKVAQNRQVAFTLQCTKARRQL